MFKIINDVKNEPTLKEAQKFVGGYVWSTTKIELDESRNTG